jgi:hypothetical protein
MLSGLPDAVLFWICSDEFGLSACDLARLECVARSFRRRSCDLLQPSRRPSTVAERAAEARLLARPDYWRVAARPGESWVYVLHVFEARLWSLNSVAAGQFHTLAVADDGTVRSFGSNSHRQLGRPCMHEKLRSPITELGGFTHAMSRNTLAAVGFNSGSQHRQPPAPHPISPGDLQGYRKALGESVSEFVSASKADQACVQLPLGVSAAAVTAGDRHSVCLDDEGSVWTWGGGRYGQLGHSLDVQSSTVVAVPCRLGGGGFPAGTRISLVSGGAIHTACVSARGDLFTWGDGHHGKLGHGCKQEMVRTPRQVMALADQRVVGLDCGRYTTAAVTGAGRLLMCGLLPKPSGPCSEVSDEEAAGAAEAMASASASASVDATAMKWRATPLPVGVDFPPATAEMLGGGEGEGGTEEEEQPRRQELVRVQRVSCGESHFAAISTSGAVCRCCQWLGPPTE